MNDFVDRLERLSRLRAEGDISDVEFENAKAQVLAERKIATASVTELTPSLPPDGPAAAPRPAGSGPAGWAGRGLAPAHPAAAAGPRRRRRDPRVLVGAGVAAILMIALLVWLMLPPTTPDPPARAVALRQSPAPVDLPHPAPTLPPLATGETLTWQAGTAIDPVERQVGPLQVRVTRTGTGDEVAPSVEVGYAGASVRMEGERIAPTWDHKIAALTNRAGAAPVVMLQSFTGGAHCCTHIQLAGLSGGTLRVVDLGSWDGEPIEPPRDRSGDGIADFVVWDQSFLYAFAPYAISLSVPQVLNVTGGRVVDVSARPAFRSLFVEAMTSAAPTCRGGEDGLTRNGACAAYVAAAARAGRLGEAWKDMLAGYDATVDWQLPIGCTVRETVAGCPAGREMQYQSYPDALLAFLKRHGYIARAWQPPSLVDPADRGFGEEPPDV